MTRPRELFEVWSLLLTVSTVPSCPVGVETIYLETIDGINVEADLVRTDADLGQQACVVTASHQQQVTKCTGRTFTATLSPPARTARWTWPIEADANGSFSKRAKASFGPAPSSLVITALIST